MEPLTTTALAASVTTVLAPILTKAGDAFLASITAASGDFGKRLGTVAGARVGDLVQLVERKLGRNPASRTAFQNFVRRPADQASQQAFRDELGKAFESDRDFRYQLQTELSAVQNTHTHTDVKVATDDAVIGTGSGITIGGKASISGGIHLTRGPDEQHR